MGATIGRHMAQPRSGLPGWIATKLMENSNIPMEQKAVELCNIQPNHKVLEVGFGPGYGLLHACNFVQGGSGEIHGTDISERMRKLASSRLQQQIADGKVYIHSHSVDNMAFDDNTFDRIFHCNSYYFWPDMDKAVGEIKRVVKPGGMVVTTINIRNVQKAIKLGIMSGNPDSEPYMNALKKHGFIDVEMKKQSDEGKLRAITAQLPED